MEDFASLETRAQELVQMAKKAGASACDCVVARGVSLSVSVREGDLEDTDRSEGDAVSLRVFCGNRVASITANTHGDAQKLAERAVAMAKVSPEDPYAGLADADLLCPQDVQQQRICELDLYDEARPDTKLMETRALEAEKAGLSVKDVSKSMGAGMGYSVNGFVLATSHGFSGSYRRSGYSLSAQMVAGEGTGMERDYEFDSKTHLSDLELAETIGQEAGKRAARRLNPRQMKSGSYPVVFDRRLSSGMVSALVGAINGSSIARKTSFLKESMGERVMGETIRIKDNPFMKRKGGSRVFDGEGVDCDVLELIRDGVLQTWLLDSATARELGLATNGRASRGGAGTSPSTTNVYMENGTLSVEELIGDIEEGLYITETIGHGINMVTGDYSKGAGGFLIENGELTHPIAEVTIAGNLKDMFLNLHPANDLQLRFSTNAPTLRVEGMTVGGT